MAALVHLEKNGMRIKISITRQQIQKGIKFYTKKPTITYTFKEGLTMKPLCATVNNRPGYPKEIYVCIRLKQTAGASTRVPAVLCTEDQPSA